MSARSALKIEIGYGQMREIIWIWGQTREILQLGQTCEISEARHRHTTHLHVSVAPGTLHAERTAIRPGFEALGAGT